MSIDENIDTVNSLGQAFSFPALESCQKGHYVSDMENALSEKILKHAKERPEGAPICAKEFLHLGNRAAVDQTLSRLVRRKHLMRAGRGIYVLPIETRFGIRSPSASKVVEAIASMRGETVASHGGAAANALGLTTQVPISEVYLTSGRTRPLHLGAQVVQLRHAPRWQLASKSRLAGETIRALAWLGPEHAEEAVKRLKQKLSKAELSEIAAARPGVPEWIAKKMSELVTDG
jgi:hypothetical protein